jgi:isochorismate synthase
MDFLTYRFPGKEVVRQAGYLKEILPNESTEAFVFSNFEATVFYGFEEQLDFPTETILYHSLPEKPYVYTTREYLLQAHSFLNGIQQLGLDKAVFSRIKNRTFPIHHAEELFNELCVTYPKACVYLVSSELLGTWIGATPEVLVEIHNDQLFTMSLAGTKKSNANKDWGGKEIKEQAYVTSFIEENLKRLNVQEIEIQGPYDYQAGPVTHLKTDICGVSKNIPAIHLVKGLHPTPAVSGLPQKTAMELIASVEYHQRMLYTGVVGWIGKEHTRLFVNLRCAQLQEKEAFLYLGGGFTTESIPELELDETENKSKTLIVCMEKILRKKA